MYLHKSKRSPYYQIIYFVNGNRRTASTKKKNKTEATRYMLNFQIPEKQNESVIKISINSFEAEYVEYLVNSKSKSYVRSVKLSFRQLIRYTGDLPLSSLNLKTMEQFILVTFSRSKSSASLYYRTLKAAFNKAVDWEYIESNPFAKIKTPKIPKSIPKFFHESDIQFIQANIKDILMKQIIVFAFNTGMRAGEIVNLKWSAINLEEKLIYVHNSSTFITKSGKERVIPMNKNVWRIILKLEQEKKTNLNTKYVFIRNSCIKLNQDFISKKFKRILRDLNFQEGLHFHSLRHSFASNLVQKDVSLYVIKELLGHESISTTQIYSHLQNDNLEKATSLFAEM